MSFYLEPEIIDNVVSIARQASDKILRVYHRESGFTVEVKQDESAVQKIEEVSTEKVFTIKQHLKKEDIGVGLAVKPNTPIEIILPYLNEVDLVLIMTVEPGFGGQSFMPNMLKKVKHLQSYKKQHPFIIQVDGGINDDHIQLCQEAGVDVAVVGSYLFKQQDMKAWLKKNQ